MLQIGLNLDYIEGYTQIEKSVLDLFLHKKSFYKSVV